MGILKKIRKGGKKKAGKKKAGKKKAGTKKTQGAGIIGFLATVGKAYAELTPAEKKKLSSGDANQIAIYLGGPKPGGVQKGGG